MVCLSSLNTVDISFLIIVFEEHTNLIKVGFMVHKLFTVTIVNVLLEILYQRNMGFEF